MHQIATQDVDPEGHWTSGSPISLSKIKLCRYFDGMLAELQPDTFGYCKRNIPQYSKSVQTQYWSCSCRYHIHIVSRSRQIIDFPSWSDYYIHIFLLSPFQIVLNLRQTHILCAYPNSEVLDQNTMCYANPDSNL